MREIVEKVLRDVVDEDADQRQPAEKIEAQVARQRRRLRLMRLSWADARNLANPGRPRRMRRLKRQGAGNRRRATPQRQSAVMPPSTARMQPVMYDAASDAATSMTRAISSAPGRASAARPPSRPAFASASAGEAVEHAGFDRPRRDGVDPHAELGRLERGRFGRALRRRVCWRRKAGAGQGLVADDRGEVDDGCRLPCGRITRSSCLKLSIVPKNVGVEGPRGSHPRSAPLSGPGWPSVPALLTAMSSRPKASTARSIELRTSFSSRTSARTNSASCPVIAKLARQARGPPRRRRPETTTRAPLTGKGQTRWRGRYSRARR